MSAPDPSFDPHETEIVPMSPWRGIDWAELLCHRDLFWFLVWREIKARYAQSILGVGWAVLHPLIHMVVFTVVFGRLLEIDSQGRPYALFSFVALVPWTYFVSATNASTNSLVGNTRLLTKVYMPRLFFPATPVIAKLIDFIIASCMLVLLMLAYLATGHRFALSADLLVLPLLIAIMMLTALGLGMWLSALAVKYRDVRFALGFMTQLMLFAAPVAWPASKIPETYQMWYGLYPMAGVIEGFRAAILQTRPMPWELIVPGAASSVVIFVGGLVVFRRMERYFADVA